VGFLQYFYAKSHLFMQRSIESHLLSWKNKPGRLPLIIRGARQVGKTYTMKWLGENHFRRVAYFNFDERPDLAGFFKSNKDVDRLIQDLVFAGGVPIDQETLIIFDEIQECPEALNTLKYFAEKKPELAILSAGSLLGLLLRSQHSFPVGKVEFLTMYPMTFREVLPQWDASAAAFLEQFTALEELPDFFFHTLNDLFKRYLITGGLPAVVKSVEAGFTPGTCDQLLDNLILSYKGDFAKHPVMKDVAKIGWVFDSLPAQLARENKKFVYGRVRTGARAKDYEDAIEWLISAGLVHRVKLISKPGIPLSAYEDMEAFKLYSFDVGIMRRMAKLSAIIYGDGNRMFTEFKGAMIENCVLQSLVAGFGEAPHYWTSGNTAEVDFILTHENSNIPIEVKSDENIRSRSLTLYREKYAPGVRIRYSLKNLHFRDGLLNIPYFMCDFTKDILGRLEEVSSER
jgi:predicted AAA+ superfamily ATPase